MWASPILKRWRIFLSRLFSSRMGSIWVPWVVALLVTVIRLDSSMTQGRDSPGKDTVISFRCTCKNWRGGGRPFPTGPGSSPDQKWLLGSKRVFFPLTGTYSFPLYHIQWTNRKRVVLSQSHGFKESGGRKKGNIACLGSLWY